MALKAGGDDPYFREDPGAGFQRVPVFVFDLEKNFSVWKLWRTSDGRVLPNPNSHFELINDPFELGNLILLTTYFDPSIAGKAFGGFGMRAPVNPAVELNNQTYIEFDLYYPKSAAGKYMRFEIWSTSTGGEGYQSVAGYTGTARTQIYIRTSELDSIGVIKPPWIGFHDGETWYKKTLCAVTPVSSGRWDYLNIDLHTETGVKLEGDMLMLGNIKISQMNPDHKAIPNVVNAKSYDEVEPFKSKYNNDNGSFLIGVTGTGPVDPKSIRGYHYEIFVDDNNSKPHCHIKPPSWLKNLFPAFEFKVESNEPNDSTPEWALPTKAYLDIRDSGKARPDGTYNYKIHGHCLAWINQSPPWMRQIVPENITSMQWNIDGNFFTGGTNAVGPFLKVNKNIARRIYFDHIVYTMRHFMSVDPRYDSSKERGAIPFHSYDVLNVELHESRHSMIIRDNTNKWKPALRHVSWLMALTDDDLNNIKQHYVYLLFKYAHIAAPNAQMAKRYKAGFNDPDIVSDYMKMDKHDNNGSIDAYVCEKPPILTYNDYEFNIWSKAKVIYNMIKELNTEWKTDPLYDGRNLIECIGIQGHEWVTPVLAGHNQQSLLLYVDLINEGLLDCAAYSEIDMRLPYNAPGGEALAPAVLNQKQADTLGYQHALFFKMLDKYKKYIDRVIFWSQYGASWMDSYVPFDQEKMANQAYYAIMDPDRFIQGHSYLDSFFDGEYDKIKNG